MTSESERPSPLANRRVRLACLVSHPIQYQAPLLRRIAQEPDIDLVVLYGSDFSVRGYRDAGFGVGVKWDVPLLDGYRHVFLPKLRDRGDVSVASPLNRGIVRQLLGRDGRPACDALWVHGYATVNALHGMLAAKTLGIPVLLRAESWLRDRGRVDILLSPYRHRSSCRSRYWSGCAGWCATRCPCRTCRSRRECRIPARGTSP